MRLSCLGSVPQDLQVDTSRQLHIRPNPHYSELDSLILHWNSARIPCNRLFIIRKRCLSPKLDVWKSMPEFRNPEFRSSLFLLQKWDNREVPICNLIYNWGALGPPSQMTHPGGGYIRKTGSFQEAREGVRLPKCGPFNSIRIMPRFCASADSIILY